MDVKDRKILYLLDANARASYSEIGKCAHISQETVRYRINKLVQEGVITHFLTVFDSMKIGYSYYQILLKLQNINEMKKLEIVKFFADMPSATWIGNLEGSYDLAIIIAVKSHFELQRLFDQFQKYNPFVMKRVISILVRSEFLSRDYLKGDVHRQVKKIGIEESTKGTSSGIITLDTTDENICALMADDARISSVDIAKELKVSADTVVQRIRKLERSIIAGYIVIMNQEKIGQLHYKILLYLNNATEDRVRLLLGYVRTNARVIAIVHALAEWSYEIDMEVEQVRQIKEFTMEITNKFSDIIRDYDLLQIVSMPKYAFYPGSAKK